MTSALVTSVIALTLLWVCLLVIRALKGRYDRKIRVSKRHDPDHIRQSVRYTDKTGPEILAEIERQQDEASREAHIFDCICLDCVGRPGDKIADNN